VRRALAPRAAVLVAAGGLAGWTVLAGAAPLPVGGPGGARVALAATPTTTSSTVTATGAGGTGPATGTGTSTSTVDVPAPAAAVRDVPVGRAIRAVDLSRAVIDLRTEQDTGGEILVTINADVLFAFDSADLTEVARREVGELAPRIRAAVGWVRVDGYTDNLGTPAYNLVLSQRRASAVADALRAAAPGGSVSATGHGAASPVASNTRPDGTDDPTARARNRRVTVSFRPG
jgi:outer membrane protein OmpA-like peptidoglycan-associated protein